jgi:hypothetical protein
VGTDLVPAATLLDFKALPFAIDVGDPWIPKFKDKVSITLHNLQQRPECSALEFRFHDWI